MEIAWSMDEVTDFQVADLSNHMDEERVGCYIKRKSKETIDRALIELTREFVVGYIELEEAVARGSAMLSACAGL